MLTSDGAVVASGLDAVALKPAECELSRATDLPFDRLVIDWEGLDHWPDAETLSALAETARVRVTTPVRADGFDPLGDEERARAVAPRLGAAAETAPDAWIGSEGIERVALATGNAQFDLLSPSTDRDLRGLRAAGFGGDLAVYAPTVVSDDEGALLDALGEYVARRGPVSRALPDGAATDAAASGRAREVLLAAIDDYALVGTPADVRRRAEELKEAGADHAVGYPARGIEAFTS